MSTSTSPLVVGSIVEGVVTGITNFGAFVELPNGQTGLVHISEIADVYVRDIHEHLSKNDRVKVKILSVDETGRKIGLSIRQAQEGYAGDRRRRRPPASFEDKLARFMKESDERQQELRRHTEGRRSGRR